MESQEQEQIVELLYSFRQVHLSFYQLFWKRAESLGTTWIQYLVLRTLRDHPDIGLTELADFILIGNSTTSGVVNLARQGGDGGTQTLRDGPEIDYAEKHEGRG